MFRVFDVDTFAPGFDNSNTSRLDLSKQVTQRSLGDGSNKEREGL